MALRFRRKMLLAKIEGTYGTDAVPTGLADAVLANDIEISPMEGADADRGHDQLYLGANATIPYDLHMVISFEVELEPSGTAGVAPAWAPLMRACAVGETIVADTSVAYAPISENHESVTIHFNIDGQLHALTGARGTAVVTVAASGIPTMRFTFTGLWTKPTDDTLPTVDLTAWQKPRVASDTNTPTFTIAGTDHVLRSLTLDLGNQVEGRFLIGAEQIMIVDRAESMEAQIEATALATLDPYALARDQTEVELNLVHGTGAGRVATLNVPAAQVQRPGAPTEAQGIMEWPLRMVPLPVTGNDQWTITLT